MNHQEQIQEIAGQFASSTAVLQAIGDETRQHIILSMLDLPCQNQCGARVGDITAKTHLSRPAISHHLKILKDAGIVGMRKEGTKNYYYLSAENSSLLPLLSLLENIIDFTRKLNAEGE